MRRLSVFRVGHGPAVTLDDTSEATIANNAFVHIGGALEPVLSIKEASRVTLARNVFVGYGVEIVSGMSAGERRQLLADNFVVPGEPAVAK